ncbi:MAG: glycosyltransferase family 4 protein [Kaiparowitsia implicata GSE-PSE-MK54-09C]|jgi:glycosyltransferase involved in cell wall biosynthesis|nr:glycosyltransferase family 4 protein [Kaiparowitsia implicata GSE-PSE-MK54-09C]
MASEVVVVHEFDGTKYFEALKTLRSDNEIESLDFVESSVLKKFIRDFVREKKTLKRSLIRAVENAIFRIKVLFTKNKTVVVGMPPWDFRMVWYGLLASNNQFIYHTSWPYWGLDEVPRRYGWLSRVFRAFWNRVLTSPNVRIVSVSSASEKEIKQRYPNADVTVIPHVVSNEFFQARPSTFSQDFGILYVGELSEKKGIKLLPEVLKKLSDLSVNISFIGDGSLRDFVNEPTSFSNQNVYGRVTDRDKIAQIYSQHQVLLVPSLKTKKWEELFGMVIIEAMAVGLPVVASDHVGPRSLIEHGRNGFLVPEGVVDGYARYIRTLAQNPELWSEMSANARERSQQYSLDTVAAQWQKQLQ